MQALPLLPEDIDLIIFDLGGVLLNIDYSLTQKAFAALGIADISSLYAQAAQDLLFDKIETGAISPSEFRDGLRAYIEREVTDEQLDHAWNALILDLPTERLELLYALKQTHKVVLLSNTNEIHVKRFESNIESNQGLDYYRGAFHHIFYSSRIDCRKPEAAAFQHVLEAMSVSPEQSLFIDDSIQHVIQAKSMGLHAHHLELPAQDILQLFEPWGLD